MTEEEIFREAIMVHYTPNLAADILELLSSIQSYIFSQHYSDVYSIYGLSVDKFSDILCELLSQKNC